MARVDLRLAHSPIAQCYRIPQYPREGQARQPVVFLLAIWEARKERAHLTMSVGHWGNFKSCEAQTPLAMLGLQVIYCPSTRAPLLVGCPSASPEEAGIGCFGCGCNRFGFLMVKEWFRMVDRKKKNWQQQTSLKKKTKKKQNISPFPYRHPQALKHLLPKPL